MVATAIALLFSGASARALVEGLGTCQRVRSSLATETPRYRDGLLGNKAATDIIEAKRKQLLKRPSCFEAPIWQWMNSVGYVVTKEWDSLGNRVVWIGCEDADALCNYPGFIHVTEYDNSFPYKYSGEIGLLYDTRFIVRN